MLDRPVDCNIDITIRPRYKNDAPLPDAVCGNQEKNGTYYGYHHATICAQAGGRTILLATYEMTPEDSPMKVVKYLVREARKHVSIKELEMDSEFRKAELLDWLNKEGLPWEIQYPRHGRRLKLKLAMMSGTHDHDTYKVTSRRTSARTETSSRMWRRPRSAGAATNQRGPVQDSRCWLACAVAEGPTFRHGSWRVNCPQHSSYMRMYVLTWRRGKSTRHSAYHLTW